MLYALPCVICGLALEEVNPQVANNQPSGGVGLVTGGNYGSKTYDPMDGSRAELNLCDACFERAVEQGRIKFFGPNYQP